MCGVLFKVRKEKPRLDSVLIKPLLEVAFLIFRHLVCEISRLAFEGNAAFCDVIAGGRMLTGIRNGAWIRSTNGFQQVR